MREFKGKKISKQILWSLKQDIESKGVKPGLAVILVGKNPESELYVRNKREAAQKVGINFSLFRFKKEVSSDQLIEKIKELNKDQSVDGIIVQLPLPALLDPGQILPQIDFKKDVDGFHPKNRSLLRSGNPYLLPVLPSAITVALRKISNIGKKDIVVVANSDIFSETLEDFLAWENLESEIIIKPQHSLQEIREKTRGADVVISVCGDPGYLTGKFIKTGVALIDAGIRVIQGEIKGDIDQKKVKDKASFLTPVPGGIGPVTVALLLNNVFLANQKR